MVELLEIEKECVRRNGCGECNRACHICDLLQDDTELHEMYEEVIAWMKAQTSCEDAVSREAVNDAIARSAHWADMKGRIAALPSVKPVSLARVMTVDDFIDNTDADSEGFLPVWVEYRRDGEWADYWDDQPDEWSTADGISDDGYRVWTARPTEEQMKATPWA
jgi:hypothetical protein